MSDRKPVIIAVAVGGVALAANGAAAAIAISASSAPPAAADFGIIALAAAFIGLIVTMIWAFREERVAPICRERVFTPWSEHEHAEPVLFAETRGRTPLALARAAAPAPAPMLTPATSDGRVIYIAEWRKGRGVRHA